MSGFGLVLCVSDRLDPAARMGHEFFSSAREAAMNPHSPAQQLLVALEAATTERQFASALADYRAPQNERLGKRVQRDGMPSLRTLERCHNLPGKTNICRWESGDKLKFVSFTEQQLRAYLQLCKITGKLFDACIANYRRIIAQSAKLKISPSGHGAIYVPNDGVFEGLYWNLRSIVAERGPVSTKDIVVKYASSLLVPWRFKCENCISELDHELAASKFLELAERGINSIGGKRGHALTCLLRFTSVKGPTERRVCASQILGVDYNTYINNYGEHEHKLLCNLATKMRRFDFETEPKFIRL